MTKKPVIHVMLLIVVLLIVSGVLAGQETGKSLASPGEHKKKVFVDSKNKNLYWPMSLPFWVRLTPSPDENAPSFLLEKVHPVQSPPSKHSGAYMKNGIQLEIEGQQFIRWYNKITDETIFLKFYSDGNAPVTAETLEGAPRWESGGRVFYGKNLTATLVSTDETSGVEQIFFSINGEAFKPDIPKHVFDIEQDVHWRFYAVDRVGNAEKPVGVRFSVDLTPPETGHDVQTNFIGDVLSGSSTIKLAANDKRSGLKTIYYRIDGHTSPFEYSGDEIKLDGLPDGRHVISYYSDDNVLNREKSKSYSFYLDRIPPVVANRFEVDHHRDGDTDFISPRTKINLSATDNKIGVDKIEYMLTADTGKPGPDTKPQRKSAMEKKDKKTDRYETYSRPFSVLFQSGFHLVTIRAADRLGNVSTEVKLPVRMDNTPPVSGYTVEGPKHKIRDTIWITKDTKILLSARDDASGVQGIYYQLGMKAEMKRYDAPINITEEGRYLFKFHAADHVSNTEKERPYILLVDNSPPVLMKTFSVSQTGVTTGPEGGEIKIFPKYTSLFLGAMDNSVGIKGIWYTLNGSSEIEYKTPLMFKEDGEFAMTIRLSDNVGNTAEESIHFVIKE